MADGYETLYARILAPTGASERERVPEAARA